MDNKMASSSSNIFDNFQIENRINEEIEWGISFRQNRNQEKQLVLATTESLEFPSYIPRKPRKKKIKHKKHKRTPVSPAVSDRILFNRNTCTQKQYYNMLSQPRPKFHETEEKTVKSSRKSCSPRFEQLALPLKQRVLNTWQDYEDVLAPENILWLKSLLTREEGLAPKAAGKYFNKLDANKRKAKKKKLKKQGEQNIKKPQKSKIVNEVEGLSKDIVNFFADKTAVNVKHRHMMITELIKDKLVANNLVKPYKRNKHSVAGHTLYEVLDQLSVWLETNIATITDEDLTEEAGSSKISTTISSCPSSEADVLLSISKEMEAASVITIRRSLEVVQETASIISQIHGLTDEKVPDENEESEHEDIERKTLGEDKNEAVIEEKIESEGEVITEEVQYIVSEEDKENEDSQNIIEEKPDDVEETEELEQEKVLEEEKDKEEVLEEEKDKEEVLEEEKDKEEVLEEEKDKEGVLEEEKDKEEVLEEEKDKEKPEATDIIDRETTETEEPSATEIIAVDAADSKESETTESLREVEESEKLEPKDDIEAHMIVDSILGDYVDSIDMEKEEIHTTENIGVDAADSKESEATESIQEVEESEKLEPKDDIEAHMIVDSILGDYVDSIDMEKEELHKEIIPVETKRHVEEHSPDTICCVAMKKWAIWLAEVARNTHSWCQWIQEVIAKIRFFAAALKGDVKTADGKRRILYKEEWNSFKETLENDVTAWIQYNTHVKDLSEKIIVNFQNKWVVCCPACLEEKLIVSEESAHEVGDRLAEAIQKASYWRTWLEQVVDKARILTSLEIELPTAPENYSVTDSALASYTSFELIEIKTAQSPSAESSDTSVYIIEEFQ